MTMRLTALAIGLVLAGASVAEAQEHSLEGRHGVYDVDVRRADGRLVATFRGRSAATRPS